MSNSFGPLDDRSYTEKLIAWHEREIKKIDTEIERHQSHRHQMVEAHDELVLKLKRMTQR